MPRNRAAICPDQRQTLSRLPALPERAGTEVFRGMNRAESEWRNRSIYREVDRRSICFQILLTTMKTARDSSSLEAKKKSDLHAWIYHSVEQRTKKLEVNEVCSSSLKVSDGIYSVGIKTRGSSIFGPVLSSTKYISTRGALAAIKRQQRVYGNLKIHKARSA